MPKQKSSLFFISLFALLLTLFCQFHFVNASLFPLYAPLIMSLYLLKLETVLFLFLFAGLFLDMIAMSPILGFYGGLFLLIAPCLFSIRTYFFQDSFSTLFVLTFLFSLLFTIGKIPHGITVQWLIILFMNFMPERSQKKEHSRQLLINYPILNRWELLLLK